MQIVFPLLAPLLVVGALAIAAPSARPGDLNKTVALGKNDAPPAQAAAVIVHVIDAQSGQPIAGALVKIAAIGSTDPVWMGRTNAEGAYRVRGLDRGTYWIHAEVGALLVDEFVRVDDGATLHWTLALGKS